MSRLYNILALLIVAALIAFLVLVRSDQDNPKNREEATTVTATTSPSQVPPSPTPSPKTTQEQTQTPVPDDVVAPIDEFKKRITKKEFGQYITPQNSPIENERFSGYHTGTDVEYQDTSSQIEVRSIADGDVIYSNYVNGYGGVIIISHDISGQDVSSLYGHLDPGSVAPVGESVSRGQQVGHLGEEGYETDGERKHLYLGIYKGSDVELRGYVQNQSQLSKWLDPVEFINNN